METTTVRVRKKRSKFSRILKGIVFRVILVGMVIGLLGTGIMWARNVILSRQVQVVTAEDGTLQAPLETEAWAANSEQVVASPAAGRVDKIAIQGQRVPKGAAVANILAQTVDSSGRNAKSLLTSPEAGLVSYKVDGLEGLLTPQNLTEWDLAKFNNLKPNPVAGDTVMGGGSAFKIVDNLSPTYLLFRLPKPVSQAAPGDRVTLLVDGQKVRGKIIKISPQGPQNGMVVGLNAFLNLSLDQRRLKIGWLDKNPPRGEIIPRTALVVRGQEQGVFLVQDGVVTWRRVTVLAEDPEKICVKGLKSGDAVITTPGYVREGQVITTNS